MNDEVEPSSGNSENFNFNQTSLTCCEDELPVYPGPIGKRLKWNIVDNNNAITVSLVISCLAI